MRSLKDAPFARNHRDGVSELFGREPPDLRSSKYVRLFFPLGANRGRQLIGFRGHQQAQQVTEIVSGLWKAGREPIQQVAVPGFAIHVVYRLDETPAEELLPVTIHDGARYAAVSTVSEEPPRGLMPLAERRILRHRAEIRIKQLRARIFAGFCVTTNQLQPAVRGEQRSHPVGFA